MAAIETHELVKLYKQGTEVIHALDGVSLEIKSGEFVAVVGRSGSGKTTFLDILGLLLRPTAGRVVMDGVETTGLKDAERADVRARKIGFIFQEYNLLPSLTAIENVMLPLRYAPDSKNGRQRAEQLMQDVEVADRRSHRPEQLSGGQAQRVAIARALINGPQLILGDEPTGAVDTETSDSIFGLMKRLNREKGVTFVIVTHDMDIARKADRIIRLKDGKVVSDETAAAVPSPA